MSNGNSVTLVGNITRDPELRFTPERAGHGHLRPGRQPALEQPPDQRVGGGHVVLQHRVLAGDGRERRASRCRRAPACIVTGRLEQRSWETPEGEKRSMVEVVADEIGPSLRWATAEVSKNDRRGPGDDGRRRRRGGSAAAPRPTSPASGAAYDYGEEPF